MSNPLQDLNFSLPMGIDLHFHALRITFWKAQQMKIALKVARIGPVK